MEIRTANCDRCGTSRETILLINACPGGHSMFSSQSEMPPLPKSENVCADCLNDNELAQMLHPIAAFVIDSIPRDPEYPSMAVSIETVSAMFKVRNNDPDDHNRHAALRAVGFSV